MAAIDKMKITILKDGTIKTVTDPVSAANHSNAEAFLKMMARLAGGITERVKRTDKKHTHAHVHEDGTMHEHN